MLNKNTSWLKYIFALFILFASAVILSLDIGGVNYNNYNYFLESKNVYIGEKPDFSKIDDIRERKITFINYMLKAIEVVNKEICLQKKQIQKFQNALYKNGKLNSKELNKLDNYLKYYKVKKHENIYEDLYELNVKIGEIPTSFIIAQAALESGWGTSRFSKYYNNYFGLHCFTEGCGEKAKSANVYLEVFSNTVEGVLGYYHRLNTGTKFVEFRNVRNKVINQSLPKESLLDTLESYSELEGDDYKNRIISIIKNNNLQQYDLIKYGC